MNDSLHTARVLLVEDDQAHADLIRMSFEDNGLNLDVQHVSDGAQAIEYLTRTGEYTKAHRPDFIMLDINLPKMNGHEVLQRIKSDERLKTIPVIMLTTSNDERDRMQAYQHHANSYLIKPTEFQMFQDLVHDVRAFWAQWNKLPA